MSVSQEFTSHTLYRGYIKRCKTCNNFRNMCSFSYFFYFFLARFMFPRSQPGEHNFRGRQFPVTITRQTTIYSRHPRNAIHVTWQRAFARAYKRFAYALCINIKLGLHAQFLAMALAIPSRIAISGQWCLWLSWNCSCPCKFVV